MKRPKVIIDCDAGSDDALALIMLIAAHKQKHIEILTVTCVNGNTHVDNVVNNVFRVLHSCNALDIPVYKGACSALLSMNMKKVSENKFHGLDGFGDIFTDKPDISKLKNEHAVCALHNLTLKHDGDVTMLCLGPLTNIALVIKMYPDFVNSIEKFIVMGGNFQAIGNMTSQAEFNFYADPESAHIVLDNCSKKIWLLPWETCLKSTITNDWRENVFGKIDTPVVQLMNAIERNIYSSKDTISKYYIPCDVFVAGILLRPDIAKNIVMHHIDVELSGVKTRGQVVIDHLKFHEPNAYIIQDIDMEIFKQLLLFAVNPNSQNNHILLLK